MYFRFGSALVLVAAISLVGIAIEKRNLELRRKLSRQHYRMDVLRDVHARLRLETQQLGAPVRVVEAIESGELRVEPVETPEQEGEQRVPLLRWQRPAP